MSKKIQVIIISTLTTFVISGCVGDSDALSLDNCGKNGNFCYKNINFGPTRGRTYELGIKDGCRTGEGEFTKKYYLSSRDKNYFDGWILGRSRCKQILPNEGTRQEEENSRKRAEYEIQQLRLKQQSSVEDVSEESIIDRILDRGDSSEDFEDTEGY